MLEKQLPACSDCEEFDRRGFLGMSAAVVGTLAATGPAWGAEGKKAAAKSAAKSAAAKSGEAENLIRELFGTLSSEQKNELVRPWNDGEAGGLPTRLRMVNAPHFGKKIG